MSYRPGELHVDAALTNVTVAYKPNGFIADQLAPIVPVSKESDKYYVFDREESLRTFNDLRADGSEANTIEMKFSKDTYFCEEYALNIAITDRQKKNADSALKLEMRKSKHLKNTLLLSREKRVATLVRALANYATGHKVTLTGADQWSDTGFTGDPLQQIDDGIQTIYDATGQFPNFLLLPYSVATVLANNAKFLERVKYTKDNLVSSTGLPKIIRNMVVLTPGAVETTSLEGANAATFATVWGNDLVMGISNGGSIMDELSQFYTFRNEEWKTYKWYEKSKKSTFIETSVIEDTKKISDVAGYIIKNVV